MTNSTQFTVVLRSQKDDYYFRFPVWNKALPSNYTQNGNLFAFICNLEEIWPTKEG